MEINQTELEVNGVKYIRKDSVSDNAKSTAGLPLMMVRTYSAGVFFGYLESRTGKEARVLNAIRVWYWTGAASLSQLAVEGTKKPADCKFALEVPYVDLTEVIELIPVSDSAAKILKSVKTWKM